MPLLHCSRCHHEWESAVGQRCDWCGSLSYVLEPKTAFEEFCSKIYKILDDLKILEIKKKKKCKKKSI